MKAKLFPSLILLLVVTCSVSLRAEDVSDAADASPIGWSLDKLSGETITFPHAHDEPVILLFWASWCPFCKALMPHLQSLADEYPDEALTIYAINFREDGDPTAFMESEGYDFTLLLEGGEVATAYGVHATPGLLIFDEDNRLVLNLYDVMERYNAQFKLADDLSYRQKAARKAPWWAARIREALDDIVD